MASDDRRMIDMGQLMGDSDSSLWHGTISLKNRLQSGELAESEIEASLAGLDQYFVPAAPGAAKRCIDGSTIRGYDDTDPAWSQRKLGPQIQGGSVDEAIAVRLAHGPADGISLLDDLAALPGHRHSAYLEGDHTDDHADRTKTGCGAIDGQLRKLAKYNDPSSPAILATVTALMELAGRKMPESGYGDLQRAAAGLLTYPGYFAAPDDVLTALRSLNPDGVETLVRPHAEVSLTLNFVTGTTFHRDHYNARTGSKIQNFNLDVWNILDEHQDTAYILLADAVATAMDLTDGSLRLFARV